jgi:hypothetical protein
MADDLWSKDMLELMQKMWNPMGFPMPGMVAPTVNVEEIERKIGELKSVDNWLKMNQAFLQMTIKTLEMQKSALETLAGKASDSRGSPSG